MTNPEDLEKNDDTLIEDLFRPVVRYRKIIGQATIAITLLVAVVAGIYYVFQPTTSTMTLGFRPTFEGVQEDKYPNGLPFSSSDIVAPSVVSIVFARNGLEQSCSLDAFRSGLVVQETSPDLQFLQAEYQARLSEASISPIERQRLQEEFNTRRALLPSQFELRFLKPAECAGMSNEVVAKAMTEILDTWATEMDEKRGVLKLRVGILRPSVFDQTAMDEPLLVRADLVRSAMVRVVANIEEVEGLPGAELIEIGDGLVSLAEVRARIEDLMQARLDPLIAFAGAGLGKQSIQWITQALNTATAQHQAAEKKADSYRQAMREYSGIATTPSGTPSTPSGPDPTGSSSDVQALTPQIDRTFIDRIVEMSDSNTMFRQEITRLLMDASVEAVEKGAAVEHYRVLLESMQGRDPGQMPTAEIERRLLAIATEAKEATRLFGELYDEFSRVGLRASPFMFQVNSPVEALSVRQFSIRNYALLVLGVFLITPILLAVFVVVQHHLQRFVSSMRTA